MKVKTIILKTAGTNCDYETEYTMQYLGAETEIVHINQLINGRKDFNFYHILIIPGGFTYGDDIAAGKILANELKYRLLDKIIKFIEDGKLILGICNGFQVLVKTGLLPMFEEIKQETTLYFNDSFKFEDRWVYLKVNNSKCIFTKDMEKIIYLPIAHAEGKFVTQDEIILKKLETNKQIVFQYVDKNGNLAEYPHNPNGSYNNIAGICDKTGRILGLMPHPERYIKGIQHPYWTKEGFKKDGDGIILFRNAIKYVNENL